MPELIIHRGTNEIGGSILELSSNGTKILFDFGIPLESMDCKDYSINDYKPELNGLYKDEPLQYQAIFLTHAHPDHYGLLELINPAIPIYASKVTFDILSKVAPMTTKFKTGNLNLHVIDDVVAVGDFAVKIHNVDHSIAGACAFEIKIGDKVLVYTGDLRFHGRCAWQSSKLAKLAQEPDYLIMEGTTLGRAEQNIVTEDDLIPKFVEVFESEKLPVVMFSPQNLDRFITVYKACLKTKRTLVIDPYTCFLLDIYKQVSNNIPQIDWNNIGVYFVRNSITQGLAENKELYKYKHNAKKISIEDILKTPEKYVIKGNFGINHKLFKKLPKGNLSIIYSMWKGYLEKPSYLDEYKDIIIPIHTSGHAYIKDLQDFVEMIKPKSIIPIHTENKEKYAELFDAKIIELNNGEILKL